MSREQFADQSVHPTRASSYQLPPRRTLSVDGFVQRPAGRTAPIAPTARHKPPVLSVPSRPPQQARQPAPRQAPVNDMVKLPHLRPRPIPTPQRAPVRQPAMSRPVQAAPAVRPVQQTSHAQPAPKPAEPVAPIAQAFAQTTSEKRWYHRLRWLQMPAVIIGSIIGGILLQTLLVGEIAIALYAVAVVILRIRSGTTFTLALMALGAMIFMLLFNPAAQNAENFATYAFLLLIIGVVSLVVEQRFNGNKRRRIA